MSTIAQKYKIEKTDSSINLIIPYQKYWVLIFFLSLGFFILLGIVVSSFVESDLNVVLPLIFFCFVPFAILIFIELIWLLIGKEVIEVNKDCIVIKHQIIGFGLSRKLISNKINGVFVARQNNYGEPAYFKEIKFVNFSIGKVAINYGKTIFGGVNTIRFGSNLSEGEAKQIVGIIHESFPCYIYSNPPKTG
jgi:hypothetical protein